MWCQLYKVNTEQNIYNILLINMTQSCQIKQRYTFHLHPALLNNTCVQHNFKSVHVSNLFWSREYNSGKEICKYASFSKVGGNYPLDLKIIWSSVKDDIDKTQQMAVTLRSFERNMIRLRNCSFNFILLQKQYIKETYTSS